VVDSQTGAIKDKFLAGVGAIILLACYMALMFYGLDTKFIEGAFLVILGVFGGLLKQTTTPQANVTSSSDTTNVVNKTGE
jgi:hypothetical protein